jgi:outer membrane protein assembly factor BamB
VRERRRGISGDVAELHAGRGAGVDQRTDPVERGASGHLPAVNRMGHRAGPRIPRAGADSTADRTGPAAAELCGERGWPVVAAYDVADGSVRWSACDPEGGLFVMAAASEDTVWVAHDSPTGQEYLAFDASSGAELRRIPPAQFQSEVPTEADKSVETAPLLDGVQLTGGQQVPMTGTNAATGTTLWSQPGHLVYDDAWAVGDGAVFAVENDLPTPRALVGYDVATGEVRWRHELAADLWPFHVTGQRLLVMWNNLQVLATDDGSVQWETCYPQPQSGFPRMMGGAVNSQSVFVSFTSKPSGGD